MLLSLRTSTSLGFQVPVASGAPIWVALVELTRTIRWLCWSARIRLSSLSSARPLLPLISMNDDATVEGGLTWMMRSYGEAALSEKTTMLRLPIQIGPSMNEKE